MKAVETIGSCLVGRKLVAVERSEHEWLFAFLNNVGLHVFCPWRIIANGRIALGDVDHGQQFGLPRAVDAVEQSNSLLSNRTVTAIKARDDAGDLTIEFSGRTALEVLNNSSGYEGWHLFEKGAFVVVAMGGGELAVWDRRGA